MHGVSLSIGSVDPLNTDYLDSLATLADRVQPRWISDHLCRTGVDAHNLHDLMPLPYAGEAVSDVAKRVRKVQERLGRRIALEDVSSYLAYTADSMDEAEFIVAVAEEADCGILLDVNNIYVGAHNHGLDAEAYVDAIPAERVFQIHLAGHSEAGELLIDTHDHPVRSEVWAQYDRTVWSRLDAHRMGRSNPTLRNASRRSRALPKDSRSPNTYLVADARSEGRPACPWLRHSDVSGGSSLRRLV